MDVLVFATLMICYACFAVLDVLIGGFADGREYSNLTTTKAHRSESSQAILKCLYAVRVQGYMQSHFTPLFADSLVVVLTPLSLLWYTTHSKVRI